MLCLSVLFNKGGMVVLCLSVYVVQQGGMVVLCLRVHYNKVGRLCRVTVCSSTRWDGCAESECTGQQGGTVVLNLSVLVNKVGRLC